MSETNVFPNKLRFFCLNTFRFIIKSNRTLISIIISSKNRVFSHLVASASLVLNDTGLNGNHCSGIVQFTAKAYSTARPHAKSLKLYLRRPHTRHRSSGVYACKNDLRRYYSVVGGNDGVAWPRNFSTLREWERERERLFATTIVVRICTVRNVSTRKKTHE